MHVDRIVRALLVAAPVLLAGCGAAALLTKPGGDGGWNHDRRTTEMLTVATAARVDLDPPPAGTLPPPTAPVDLATALAQAAHGNRPLAEAREQLAIAQARVAEARGRLFPTTRGQGRYTAYNAALENQVDIPGANGTETRTIEIRDKDLGTVGGAVTVPIDLTGELRWSLKAAQAGYRGEAARLFATQLAEDVVVIGAYYTLLEAERLRDVTAQTIALQREQLRNADERYTSGRLTKNELLVVQVRLKRSEQRLVRRDLAIDEARWALNTAMGVAIDAPTSVLDVRARPELPPLPDALRVAYADNPLLLALVEEQQRLEATTTALERSRFPRFNGGGAVDWSSTRIIDPTTVGSGFVGFEWDLGTDTQREARIAQAAIEARRNRIAIERELREVERAVRSAYHATQERLAALDSATAAVEQAEENLRIRQQQFGVGRATSEDVLDATTLLASERATLATALYQAQTRRAELQRLMGQPMDPLLAASR